MKIGDKIVVNGIEYELKNAVCGNPTLEKIVEARYNNRTFFKVTDEYGDSELGMVALVNGLNKYQLICLDDGLSWGHDPIIGDYNGITMKQMRDVVDECSTIEIIEHCEAADMFIEG